MKSLFLALVLALGSMTGCAATQIDRARQSVTTAVSLYSGGIKALDAADEATEKNLLAQVHAGILSNAEANAQYGAFRAKYDVAVKAFGFLYEALRATADATAAADAKLQSDIPGAVASLTTALGDVVRALQAIGIKLPGVSS